MLLLNCIYIIALILKVSAKTHTFNFNTTYVDANPDGLFQRKVIGINNEWPIPTIRVKKDDRVIIHLTNLLQVNTSLHFHGLFQKDSNAMDGPEYVTQCPIAPGQTFTYNFTVPDQAGTYWYHSHSGAQYSDGLRGLFIIEDDLPFNFDEEVTLTVSDWYHKSSGEIMKKFLNRYNPTGSEPIPQNTLFNETKKSIWSVKPDTTYFLRIANMGMFTSQFLYIEDHTFTIVEVDGVLIEPKEVDYLYIAVAQRYGVLVKTKENAGKNFRFINAMDQEMLDSVPDDLEIISTNWVVYDDNIELPKPLSIDYDNFVNSLGPFDDFGLETLAKTPLLSESDYRITLTFEMNNLGDGINYAFFNDITYTHPKVPTLMTVFSSGEYAMNEKVYGSNTNSYVLQDNEVVEIVLNNNDAGKHPFHLHGHVFQVVARSPEGEEDEPYIYDPTNSTDHEPEFPMMRDTVMVNPFGYVVLRFTADNPGVWLFHCHVDWHLEQGLAITLIEAPLSIQKHQTLPSDHLNTCIALDVPYYGNAAGNFGEKEEDWIDLTGENLQFAELPPGFTPKGYIAMALCTFVALYGVFTIYRYGMEDITTDESDHLIHKLYDILDKHIPENERSERTALSAGEVTEPVQ